MVQWRNNTRTLTHQPIQPAQARVDPLECLVWCPVTSPKRAKRAGAPLEQCICVQGRALLNAVGNLGVTGAYAEALTKLGVSLEEVADAVSEEKLVLANAFWIYPHS